MMQSTICLPRFSRSLPLKCNVHKTIKGLSRAVMWAKRWGKGGGQIFLGFVELEAMMMMEQPTKDQRISKAL